MLYKLQLKIPGLPKRINAIHGRHWSVKHREATKWMRSIQIHARTNFPSTPLKKASVKFVRGSSICPDFDGLVSGFKSVTDALVKLKIIEDDNMNVIGQPKYEWVKAKPGSGFIEIVVEELC